MHRNKRRNVQGQWLIPANNCITINSPCLTILNLGIGWLQQHRSQAGISSSLEMDGITALGAGSLFFPEHRPDTTASGVTRANTPVFVTTAYQTRRAKQLHRRGEPPAQTIYTSGLDGMRLVKSTTAQVLRRGDRWEEACDNTSGQNHDIVITHNNGTEVRQWGLGAADRL